MGKETVNQFALKRLFTRFNLWIMGLSSVIVAGLVIAYQAFAHGLDSVFAADDIVVWTLPIASYVFFALTSTGLTFVASLPLSFGVNQYNGLAKRAVFLAIAALLAAFVSLSLDLGSILNLFYFLITPNLSSPLWWMGALYSLEILLLVIKFWQLHSEKSTEQFSKIVGWSTFVAAIAASSMLGAVFGLAESRPTWFGGFLPVYFPVTAFMSGVAVLLLFSLLSKLADQQNLEDPVFEGLGKLLVLSSGLGLVFFLWRMIVASNTSIPQFEAFTAIMKTGSFQTELWIGLVLPFILLLVPAVRSAVWGKISASALILLGLFLGRINLVAVGQIEPVGVRAGSVAGLVSFTPSLGEWIVFLFSLALLLLIFTLGEKYLKLDGAAG